MALSVFWEVAAGVFQPKFFCVMCDDCTNSSNKEKLVICIRWINHQLELHEEFIGLYNVDDICADTIVTVIKDTLSQMNLSLIKCPRQCYDSANVMRVVKNGVANTPFTLARQNSFDYSETVLLYNIKASILFQTRMVGTTILEWSLLFSLRS